MQNLKDKYFRPTPVNWRIAGDLALLLIPLIQISITNAPNISDTAEYWLNEPLTWALVAFKFMTNLAVKK